MAEKKIKSRNYWEVPDVDLNLRHYSGPVFDVFKKIKSDIVDYLSTSDKATEKSRQIYSAIYNALDYYEILSPDFSIDSEFLASSIQTFNEDFEYLSDKYRRDNPSDPQVISLSARIKSPLSFVEKVKDKVNEYLEQDRDFIYFNESLRDIIGVRVVVDPPTHIKNQGLQAESDYLYDIFYDLMCQRGILEDLPSSTPTEGKFKFIDVNTRYDRNKLEKMKSSLYPGAYISTDADLTDEAREELKQCKYIVKPKTRPSYMSEIDSKVKDYRLYPKKSGYQSIHICVVPSYSSFVRKPQLPACIIPPATSDYSLEYQFRDARENNFSENGPASHETLKPFEKMYHRLAVPSFIACDDEIQSTTSTGTYRKILKPRNFGENYQKFYGPSFEDRFGISYYMFKYTFDEQTQDDILAQRKYVAFDDVSNTYIAVDNPMEICVEKEDRDDISDEASVVRDLLLESSIRAESYSEEEKSHSNADSKKKKHSCVKFYKLVHLNPAKRKARKRSNYDSNGIDTPSSSVNRRSGGSSIDDDL